MASATFGNKWPSCQGANMRTLRRHDGLVLVVHYRLVNLVALCCDVIEALGYDLHPGECWGYACRPIAGTSVASNHSQGTAIDINAPHNPRRADRKFVTDIPANVIAFMTGAGFRWGGWFDWPDTMHFEFIGTADDAEQKERDLRAFFASLGGNTPPQPIPIGDYNVPATVHPGDRGLSVRKMQGLLIAQGGTQLQPVDGVYGDATGSVLRFFQAEHGLEGDGICGPQTWRALIER
jgi:hypothetical protein